MTNMNMQKRGKNSSQEERKRVVTALKALANENRLAIFERIRSGCGQGQLDLENRLSICAVAEKFDITLSTISHHIKELRTAGLVHCERRGQSIL